MKPKRKSLFTRLLSIFLAVALLLPSLALGQGKPGTIYTPTPNAQAWTYKWTCPSGSSLANLFALYPSQGNVTISTATQIPTTLDGPIQVVRYGNLTVNAALTTTNRNRGLIILCDSLTMGASGSISMTGRGAAGDANWVVQDLLVPTSIVLTGQNTRQQAFFQYIASTGYFLGDPNLFARPPPGFGDVQADYASWVGRGTSIISAAGCGTGASGHPYYYNNGGGGANGYAGSAGSSAPGGGGGGGIYVAGAAIYSGRGGPGTPWGGGSASGGVYGAAAFFSVDADQYGGAGSAGAGFDAGGGAGNPPGVAASGGSNGGTGTGGDLIILVRGNVTLTTGHLLSANGIAGGSGGAGSGGAGSGGGKVGLYYLGTLTGTPNLTATGGSGGLGTGANGGVGGAGATTSTPFSAAGY